MTNLQVFNTALISMLMLLMVIVLMGSRNVTGSKCSSFAVDDAFDMYFDVGKNRPQMLDISYQPDDTGTAVGVTLDLQFCSGTNDPDRTDATMDNCQDLDFPTDSGGVGDTNTLDGGAPYAIEKVGLGGLSGFNYLRVFRTGDAPSAGPDTPILTVCRRAA